VSHKKLINKQRFNNRLLVFLVMQLKPLRDLSADEREKRGIGSNAYFDCSNVYTEWISQAYPSEALQGELKTTPSWSRLKWVERFYKPWEIEKKQVFAFGTTRKKCSKTHFFGNTDLLYFKWIMRLNLSSSVFVLFRDRLSSYDCSELYNQTYGTQSQKNSIYHLCLGSMTQGIFRC
jgi:hypothetical protein